MHPNNTCERPSLRAHLPHFTSDEVNNIHLSLCLLADLCGSWRRIIAAGGESSQTSVLLLLVDALPLRLRELQEAVHGPKVDQQRLGGVFGVLLLPQNL